ncbi:MAG: hypothetical protein MI919_37350 [Holophagales bacterium]|nr:hypothetical protein [Holophagales bacterium]
MPRPRWLSPRSILLLVVLLLVVVFAALNWSTLEEPAPLDFLIVEVEAPLGVLLLLVVAVFTLLFLALIAQMEAAARGERKRLLADLERWRDLAENAEASRIAELREAMEAGFDDLYDRIDRGPRRGCPIGRVGEQGPGPSAGDRGEEATPGDPGPDGGDSVPQPPGEADG